MTYATIFLAVLSFLKSHYMKLGYPLAALFCFLWLTKKPECPKQDNLQVVKQEQTNTQAAKVKTIIKLVPQYIEVPGEAPKPLPCPSLEFSTEAGAESVHWQSQGLTNTPNLAPSERLNALFIGGGYLSGPILSAGYRRDILTLQAIGWTDRVGGLATVDLVRWK